jgi:hypothetical protein
VNALSGRFRIIGLDRFSLIWVRCRGAGVFVAREGE